MAGLSRSISPHQLRHFLLTWLKKQGIDDALIQPYLGHASRQSLEVYSRLAIGEAQKAYDEGDSFLHTTPTSSRESEKISQALSQTVLLLPHNDRDEQRIRRRD